MFTEADLIMAELRTLAGKIAYHEAAIRRATAYKAKAEARHAELTRQYQNLTKPS